MKFNLNRNDPITLAETRAITKLGKEVARIRAAKNAAWEAKKVKEAQVQFDKDVHNTAWRIRKLIKQAANAGKDSVEIWVEEDNQLRPEQRKWYEAAATQFSEFSPKFIEKVIKSDYDKDGNDLDEPVYLRVVYLTLNWE